MDLDGNVATGPCFLTNGFCTQATCSIRVGLEMVCRHAATSTTLSISCNDAAEPGPFGHLQTTQLVWTWTHHWRNNDSRGVFPNRSFTTVAHVCHIGAYAREFQK